jgi:tetratricopeptide (TPR) repeat protein
MTVVKVPSLNAIRDDVRRAAGRAGSEVLEGALRRREGHERRTWQDYWEFSRLAGEVLAGDPELGPTIAEAIYRSQLRCRPDEPLTRLQLAEALLVAGKYEQAEAECRRLLPSDVRTDAELGGVENLSAVSLLVGILETRKDVIGLRLTAPQAGRYFLRLGEIDPALRCARILRTYGHPDHGLEEAIRSAKSGRQSRDR